MRAVTAPILPAMEDHAAIIAALGGPVGLAEKLGRHHSRGTRWKRDGIPVVLWFDVAALAMREGLPQITVDLLRATSPHPLLASRNAANSAVGAPEAAA